MPSLLARARREPDQAQRSLVDINTYLSGLQLYQSGYETTLATKREPIPASFQALATLAFGANGVVYACMAVRQLVFSSVRFRYQRLRDGAPSTMFGTPDLALLETPWVGGTTQDLLSRASQDADISGNWFGVADTPLSRMDGDGQSEIVRLRPDWMEIAVAPRLRNGAPLGLRKVGYIYTEGGPYSGNESVPLLPDEVAHFMPMPDPTASFRGMSWLTPIIREIENDSLMNAHKQKFFENGATPNVIIKHQQGADQTRIVEFNKRLQADHAGVDNAYKTLNLYPGADATVVGTTMQQIDFKAVQGAGETRIAAASGVPPVIVGLSEGLEAATYSNYAQARRRFADGTEHPLWENFAGSIAPLVKDQGPDTRLWYDASGIPFLREDEADVATINQTKATTINSLITAGYKPDAVVAAVESGDFPSLVGQHSGLFSVQLQAPGAFHLASEDPSGTALTEEQVLAKVAAGAKKGLDQ